jgi:hypothetical protein
MPTGWLFANAKIIVNGVPVGGVDASLKNPSGVTTMNTPLINGGVELITDGKVTGKDSRGLGELNTCVALEEYGNVGTGVELKIPLLFEENSGYTDENTGMAP